MSGTDPGGSSLEGGESRADRRRDAMGSAADRLHRFLESRFWNGRTIEGPDVGIRFNARIGRFVKGYTGLRWHDSLVYLQAQAYWLLANWRRASHTGDDRYAEIAMAGSREILRLQRSDGSWDYPNPEWAGRIATVEGSFAGLALIEAYRETGEGRFLDGAIAWHRCLEDVVGYRRQAQDGHLAVNYFAHIESHGGGVPNNATLVAWFLAELAEATANEKYLRRAPELLDWALAVQLPTGELPYLLGHTPDDDRVHFLCAQYNAFEFLDLAHYREVTADDRVLPGLRSLSSFLESSITDRSTVRYDCSNDRIEVPYYSLAVGRALTEADRLGLLTDPSRSAAVVDRVLTLQREDGGFQFYSRGNYRVLTDRRDYPRPLSMMLFHLVELSELP